MTYIESGGSQSTGPAAKQKEKPMNNHPFGCRLTSPSVGALVFVIGFLALGGCDLPFAGNDTPGWLNANVTGAVTQTFRGDGDFRTSHGNGFSTLVVSSAGVDDRSLPTSFLLLGFHVKDPEPGTYLLGIATVEEVLGSSEPLFAANYARMNDAADNGESYRSQRGEVTIEEASGDRIAGRFTFVGFERCPGGPEAYCPADPSEPPPGAKIIEVIGTFEVRPWKDSGHSLRRKG